MEVGAGLADARWLGEQASREGDARHSGKLEKSRRSCCSMVTAPAVELMEIRDPAGFIPHEPWNKIDVGRLLMSYGLYVRCAEA